MYEVPGLGSETKFKTNNPHIILTEKLDYTVVQPVARRVIGVHPPVVPIVPKPITTRKALAIGGYVPGADPHFGFGFYSNFQERAPTNWDVWLSGTSTGSGSEAFKALGMTRHPMYSSASVDYVFSLGFEVILYYEAFAFWAGRFDFPVPRWIINDNIRYATEKGMIVFTVHFDNSNNELDYMPSKSPATCVTVGGMEATGTRSYKSWGPQLEICDYINPSQNDLAESWDFQSAAARYAHVKNLHPEFNNYDARQYMRQASSFWPTNWRADGGYGFPLIANEAYNDPGLVPIADVNVLPLQPGAPTEVCCSKATDNKSVIVTWRNFLQTGWTSTIIKMNGTEIYEGSGDRVTNPVQSQNENGIIWQSTVTGSATFQFYTKVNGELSRDEPYTSVTVTGLVPA